MLTMFSASASSLVTSMLSSNATAATTVHPPEQRYLFSDCCVEHDFSASYVGETSGWIQRPSSATTSDTVSEDKYRFLN